jgi:hypothetical protein
LFSFPILLTSWYIKLSRSFFFFLSAKEALLPESRPALGKQDEVLEMGYPHGTSQYSPSMERIMRDLERFTSTPEVSSKVKVKPQLQSMLIVGAGDNGSAGATALACWAAVDASKRGDADYVRLVTSLDILSAAGGGDEEARAAALMERFSEAGEMPNSLLVFDDVDQLCAGSGPGGYSSIMLATLRALLRSPPASSKGGGHSQVKKTKDGRKRGKTLRILAVTARSDAECVTLHELFDETLVVKPLQPDISSKLQYSGASKPNRIVPCSILRKTKRAPKASKSPTGDSLRKLQLDNAQSCEDGQSSFTNTGSTKDLLKRVIDIKKQMSERGITFSENVEVYEISRLRDSAIDFCFYSENELSNFRQQAFMDDAGLDPGDHD